MDEITAFLVRDLEDVIYLKMLQLMVKRFGKYARIHECLYGLKQAARVLYLLLWGFLVSVGFEFIPTDQTIFINPLTKVVIGIHVDDLLITGTSKKEAGNLKEQLRFTSKMKDLGIARFILRMRITRKGEQLTLDQPQNAEAIVKIFAMPGTK